MVGVVAGGFALYGGASAGGALATGTLAAANGSGAGVAVSAGTAGATTLVTTGSVTGAATAAGTAAASGATQAAVGGLLCATGIGALAIVGATEVVAGVTGQDAITMYTCETCGQRFSKKQEAHEHEESCIACPLFHEAEGGDPFEEKVSWAWDDNVTGFCAAVNPKLWSTGSIDECVAELSAITQERPLAIKIPAGIHGVRHAFSNARDAQDYLHALKDEYSAPEDTAQWMWADKLVRMKIGANRMDEARPKWSSVKSAELTLAELAAADPRRPIVLKMPARPSSIPMPFPNAAKAMEYLQHAKDTLDWTKQINESEKAKDGVRRCQTKQGKLRLEDLLQIFDNSRNSEGGLQKDDLTKIIHEVGVDVDGNVSCEGLLDWIFPGPKPEVGKQGFKAMSRGSLRRRVDDGEATADCWRPIIHDTSTSASDGLSLTDLLKHPCVRAYAIGYDCMFIDNAWQERWMLVPVVLAIDPPRFALHSYHVRKAEE